MRTVCKVVLSAAALCLLAGPALAQQRGFGFGGGFGSGAMLLGNRSVQEALKLTKEQADQAQEARQTLMEKQKEAFAKFRDLSQEERSAKMPELNRAMAEETNKVAAKILKPEQLKRFQQIELQQRGVQALTDAAIQTTLKLTDDQKEKVKLISEDAAKELREVFQGGAGGNFQEIGKKMAALRKESMERVSAILTADQKKAWKELTGDPFEVRMELPGRPGGN